MEDQIKDIINLHFDVDILFISELGSRAWGTSSQSSDHDIRFVYYYPKDRYLSLFDNVKDTITIFDDRDTYSLDLVGWDIFKFLRLLSKSNPSTLEWLFSPNLLYRSKYFDKLSEIGADYDPYTLMKHYHSMAKSNYTKYIVERIDPSIKVYIQIIRSLLNAIYLLEFEKYPPLIISECLERLLKTHSWDINLVSDQIVEIISMKQTDETLLNVESSFNFWVAETLDQLHERIEKLADTEESPRSIDKNKLEEILQDVLSGN